MSLAKIQADKNAKLSTQSALKTKRDDLYEKIRAINESINRLETEIQELTRNELKLLQSL